MLCLNFFHKEDSNGQILKTLASLNTTKIFQRFVFPKLILNIQKNYSNYAIIILSPLAPDKTGIKGQTLPSYHLKNVASSNISVGVFEKLMPNYFNKEKYMLHYENFI